jgi:hypothetical protein
LTKDLRLDIYFKGAVGTKRGLVKKIKGGGNYEKGALVHPDSMFSGFYLYRNCP